MTEGARSDIAPNQMLACQERETMDSWGWRQAVGWVQVQVWAP